MEKIIEYIKANGLDGIKKDRDSCYQRYYLYNILREHGLTLYEIGDMFNKLHCTVIYGIRMHKLFEEMNDVLYKEHTERVRVLFDVPANGFSLEHDVLKCNTVRKLELIKLRIRCKYYEKTNEETPQLDTV